jgi:hypothetical protein
MRFQIVRYLAVVAALSLGGCLEPIGHPPYNHGESYRHVGLCHLTGGPDTGACKLDARQPTPSYWRLWW